MPKGLHQEIAAWYGRHGRHDLPWRKTSDPYVIWISEVMLQQTQVATVEERYFIPFLERFPTIQALAEADQDTVLKLWQGLGYYNRAVNLHRAAQMVVEEEFDFLFNASLRASLPSDEASSGLAGFPKPDSFHPYIKALQSLPGIGRNTAHAIAAFAFHLPVPVLEANVKRVVARFFALKQPADAELWQKAEDVLNRDDPFTHNQAMMDIGALVCTPKAPQCGVCPLTRECEGKANPEHYPMRKVKKKVPVRKRVMLVYERNGKYFLTQRTTQFLRGLYGFVQVEGAVEGAHLGVVNHTYSHFKLQADVIKVTEEPTQKGDWYTLDAVDALPLSKADEKALALINA